MGNDMREQIYAFIVTYHKARRLGFVMNCWAILLTSISAIHSKASFN